MRLVQFITPELQIDKPFWRLGTFCIVCTRVDLWLQTIVFRLKRWSLTSCCGMTADALLPLLRNTGCCLVWSNLLQTCFYVCFNPLQVLVRDCRKTEKGSHTKAANVIQIGIWSGPSPAGGPVVPGPPFEICAPPFHVWPPGCCIHLIQYFKNVVPPSHFWPLLLVFGPPAAKSWRRAWL